MQTYKPRSSAMNPKLNVASVPIPALAEQQRIVAEVDELMAAIDSVQG